MSYAKWQVESAAELGFEPRVARIQSPACYRYTTPQRKLGNVVIISKNFTQNESSNGNYEPAMIKYESQDFSWPHRLAVRTQGFHPCNPGSIPGGVTLRDFDLL